MNYAKYIDHTLLKPDATESQIKKLCGEALEYHFASVCVNPNFVNICADILKESDVKVCTVIGFPLGATPTVVKVFETENAILDGADEIDMVINIGALKEERYDDVYQDISQVVQASRGKIVKVILETCLLSDEQIVTACRLAIKAQASFVKTSTGFSNAGANEHVVRLMKDVVKDSCLVKASGGIRTVDDMKLMIHAGADRIGTSSGVSIMQSFV